MLDIGVVEFLLLLATIAFPVGLAVAAIGALRHHLRGTVESRLDDLDRLLKAGRISPAEHVAARASALGIAVSESA